MENKCQWCEKGHQLCEHSRQENSCEVCNWYKNRGMVYEGTPTKELRYCPKKAA